LRFRGASEAVGAGRLGSVVVGVTDSVVEFASDSEADVVLGSADFRPVSCEAKTPMATDARMIKIKANPHYRVSHEYQLRAEMTYSPHHPLSLDSLLLLLLFPPSFTNAHTPLAIHIPSFPAYIEPYQRSLPAILLLLLPRFT
jgi:hypothetical protein